MQTMTTSCREVLRGLTTVIIALGICLWAGAALGQQIDATHKYAWSENAGWQNWRATHGQATVHSDHLTGFVWAENIGWIKLGADAGGPYANTAANNWGVNRNGAGNLSGYAWSETSGWINFNPTHGGGVSIDPATGDFSGYAWGENIGWTRLAGATYGVRTTGAVPPDPTAIPTMSEWGMIILSVLMLITGIIMYRRREQGLM